MEGKDEEDRLINVYCVAPNEEESTHPWRQRLCGHWREEIRKGSRWVYTPNNFVIDYWQKNIPVCNVYFIFLFFMLILGKIQDEKKINKSWNSFFFSSSAFVSPIHLFGIELYEEIIERLTARPKPTVRQDTVWSWWTTSITILFFFYPFPPTFLKIEFNVPLWKYPRLTKSWPAETDDIKKVDGKIRWWANTMSRVTIWSSLIMSDRWLCKSDGYSLSCW